MQRMNRTPGSQKYRYAWLLLTAVFFLFLAWVVEYYSGSNPDKVSQEPSVLESHLVADSEGFKAMKATVTKVADGDTVYIRELDGTKTKVRLLGIDAPELKMPYGQQSKQALESLVQQSDNKVVVHFKNRDQYNRIVGKLEVNGKDLNLEQVKNGNAWVYKNYLGDVRKSDRPKLQSAEKQAKAERLGLWKQDNPQEPWTWRKENPRN